MMTLLPHLVLFFIIITLVLHPVPEKQTNKQKLENSAASTVMVKVIFQQEEKYFVFMGFCVILVFYFLFYILLV